MNAASVLTTTLIFEGPTLETTDDRRACGETRIRAIGLVDDNLNVMVYTDCNAIRRITSARAANR